MDLLAPWKMCLQCLPVFSPHPLPPPPPPPSKAVPLHTTSEKSTGAAASAASISSENDCQEAEKPSFSDASLAHDHQHEGLPLSDYAKDAGSPVYAPAEMNPVAKGDAEHVDDDVNQGAHPNTVQAPQDFEFGASSAMALPSPVTPAPIGLGSIVGEHAPSHHIHHQVKHNKGHSFFHIHGHGHGKAPTLHPNLTPNEGHAHPALSSPQSEGDGGKEEAHQHTDHQHSHKQNDDTSHPPSVTSHVHGLHTSTLPLEMSQSTPVDIDFASGLHGHGVYNDEDTAMNALTSSTLETSQAEPIDVGAMRVRRRDQLKHQFKDLRNQLKQGGHHLKEEGSKHLQNMVSTMNKQAQQIEGSGSFFMARHSDAS